MFAGTPALLASAVALAALSGAPPAAIAPQERETRRVESPTVAVDAGADLDIEFGQSVVLSGTVLGLDAIHYWAGDGNKETENRMLIYHSDVGFEVFGPLALKGSTVIKFGWPSDVVRIDGVVYGIETGHRRFYALNETTAECTPIGPPLPYQWLTCLAYDKDRARLFAVDAKLDQLLTIDVRRGTAKHIGGTLPYDEVKGMAYHARSGRLFAYDSKTDELFTIDTSSGQTEPYLNLRLPRGAFFDELDEYAGELYGVLAYRDADGVRMGQVQHIDLTTGALTNVGPEMYDVSAHSLMIESMPQRVKWSMVRGPGRARFRSPNSRVTEVDFTEPGDYVLRLTVLGERVQSDLLEVRVRPRDCNANGLDDLREIELDPDADGNRNGRLDECECLPAPRVYCAFEPTRARQKPELQVHGEPKPRDPGFEIGVTGGSPFQSGFLFLDADPRDRPLLSSLRSVTRPLRWIRLDRLDAFGTARVPLEVEPWMAGTSCYFRFLNISEAGSSRVGMRVSDVLWVSFCL